MVARPSPRQPMMAAMVSEEVHFRPHGTDEILNAEMRMTQGRRSRCFWFVVLTSWFKRFIRGDRCPSVVLLCAFCDLCGEDSAAVCGGGLVEISAE